MVSLEWYELNTKLYYEFIDSIITDRGRSAELPIYENHHIIPRCFGGEPQRITKGILHDNIIRLTPKEHFIAHKLLAINNLNCYNLLCAYLLMGRVENNSELLTEDECDQLRTAFLNQVSLKTKDAMNTKEVKQKMHLANLGKTPWNKGKTNVYSLDTLLKNSLSHLNKKLSEEHKLHIGLALIGKKVSDDTKKKISGALSGINCKRNIPVYCEETDTIYYNGKFAAQCLNINISNITQVCKGNRKTAGGYHFRYYINEDKEY